MKLFKRQKDDSNKKFEDIIIRTKNECEKNNLYYCDKVNTIQVYQQEIKNLPDKDKIEFILYNISKYYSEKYGAFASSIRKAYIQQLFKTKLIMDEDDIVRLIDAFSIRTKIDWTTVNVWPLSHMLNQIYSQYKTKEPGQPLTAKLNDLKSRINNMEIHFDKEKTKWISKIDDILLGESANTNTAIKPVFFIGNDAFAKFANDCIVALPDTNKPAWYKIITLAKKASGGKPSKKFLNDSKLLIKEAGNDKFKKMMNEWMVFIVNLKEKEEVHTNHYNGQDYSYTTYTFISSANIDTLKGLVWMCSHFHNNQTIHTIARLAERSYKKIPGIGPAAASIGNACLYVLYKSKGLDGIGQLSRLKLRVRQNNTQKLIDKYLKEAAKEQGVTLSEIEDLSVDDYGLTNGKKEIEFDDYNAVVEIEKIGKTTLTWYKPDGTQQKSVPKFVNEKYKTKLKKVKDSIKQINQTTSAQRDRLDRMFKTKREWNWDDFNQLYFNHGLMAFLVKNTLWNFHRNEEKLTVIYHENEWKNIKGNVIQTEKIDKVTLWHPIQSTIQEIETWRKWFSDQKIQQALKQVYREVYILTDAEINTKLYSNRMAAHILKQHQFNSLTKIRGWSYSLMGAYDDGRYNEAASIEIPEFNLKAEYWINEVNADDAFNDTGIWDYIATDQVRFISTETNNTIDMVDVPDIVLSEILRDVDLFVGVASIGNDPTWQDSGGLPRYNNYWQRYSFGDLSEIAKTRKGILENLVPRLKISQVASVQDKFLIVKGQLRTYKIHIGSTNILMEPNDQYLCIVPDRNKKTKNDLFLPFEGDAGLSVILSKAFMLAEDDKITDTTITSQINMN